MIPTPATSIPRPAGFISRMSYMNPAPKQVTVAPGDNLKISVSFKYTGPAVTGACIRYCVGVYGTFGFTEDLVAIESFNIPQVVTPPSVAECFQLAHLCHPDQCRHRLDEYLRQDVRRHTQPGQRCYTILYFRL